MKKETVTAIMVGIVSVLLIYSMAGCSPKYGCDAMKGKVFYNMHNIKR